MGKALASQLTAEPGVSLGLCIYSCPHSHWKGPEPLLSAHTLCWSLDLDWLCKSSLLRVWSRHQSQTAPGMWFPRHLRVIPAAPSPARSPTGVWVPLPHGLPGRPGSGTPRAEGWISGSAEGGPGGKGGGVKRPPHTWEGQHQQTCLRGQKTPCGPWSTRRVCFCG